MRGSRTSWVSSRGAMGADVSRNCQPVRRGAPGTPGAAAAVTWKVRCWYASVAPSACGLEAQKAPSDAPPGLADLETTRVPLQAPEALTGSWAEPIPRPPWARLTRTTSGPATPAGFGGHRVIDETVIEVPGGPAAGVLANVAGDVADAAPIQKTSPASPMSAGIATSRRRPIVHLHVLGPWTGSAYPVVRGCPGTRGAADGSTSNGRSGE
jgi:hypothetical protein